MKQSSGLAPYRIKEGRLEVFLVHPGGPFWAKKDEGAWTIAKGEFDSNEDPLNCARREFIEETGIMPSEPFQDLGSIRQKSGKIVHAWAFQGDFDSTRIRSNTTMIEWPPRSGKRIEIPEVDRGAFFTIAEARRKINPAQIPLIGKLRDLYPAEYEMSDCDDQTAPKARLEPESTQSELF